MFQFKPHLHFYTPSFCAEGIQQEQVFLLPLCLTTGPHDSIQQGDSLLVKYLIILTQTHKNETQRNGWPGQSNKQPASYGET